MDLTPTDENVPKTSKKHKKSRPSIDVQLAQNYKHRQELPPVENGVDPELPVDEDLSPGSEYVEILLDESLRAEVEEARPPRDYVTGRIISNHGQSCLRCAEKGLRCTLGFVGKEAEPQCAACRRSKAQYCVRFQSLGGNGRGIPFNGPPWKNPNFVAGTPGNSEVAHLPREQLEDILHEFYDGKQGYVLGNYVADRDVENFVLPPFNGVDLPLVDRPKNYEAMGWRDVLPDWRNRSLRPRRTDGMLEDEHEKWKRKLSVVRERSLLPNYTIGSEAEELMRMNISRMQGVTGGEDDISFLRALRKYQPRERHLGDCV
ncbi:hypothetical protein GQX73_g1432 [Xylaria multiplex]|uniref:Uncharacterized protein n=1 Tax=Xylaria multiplex TaxID=323545 RepID=A0A7C8ITQ9_9PEZI|nr:hypothetical protein GQX73_g1432 [Xylaria multiplex]